MLEASIELAPNPAELRTARRFVDETLTDWGLESICDDVRLITSELSANAVVHARTDFRVTRGPPAWATCASRCGREGAHVLARGTTPGRDQ